MRRGAAFFDAGRNDLTACCAGSARPASILVCIADVGNSPQLVSVTTDATNCACSQLTSDHSVLNGKPSPYIAVLAERWHSRMPKFGAVAAMGSYAVALSLYTFWLACTNKNNNN